MKFKTDLFIGRNFNWFRPISFWIWFRVSVAVARTTVGVALAFSSPSKPCVKFKTDLFTGRNFNEFRPVCFWIIHF